MNKVVLTGRITKDPELRTTQSGTSVVSFTLAVDRPFKDANGEKQSDFINCVAWNNQADFLAKWIKKGYLLVVSGAIQTRTYQNQQGATQYVTEVVIDSVENLTPKDKGENQVKESFSAQEINEDDLPF